MTRRGADEDVFHQPAVFRGTCLEFRHGAEIDQTGIDRLTALQLLQQLERPETDALVFDINDRAVVGLEGVFCLKLDQLVGADNLEIGAERTNLAIDVRATDVAAKDRNDATNAMTGLARADRLADPHGDGENISGLQLWRHDRPALCCPEFNAPSCAAATRWQAAGRRSGSPAGS